MERGPTDTLGMNGGRLAATVIVIRDSEHGLEVWVQERVSTMTHYAGMTVFPGGGVDLRDFPPRTWDSGDLWSGPSAVLKARKLGTTKHKAHALIFAAVRELFEETGILLAVHPDGSPVVDATPYHQDRVDLVSHKKSLTEVLRENSLQVRSDLVRPWARWIGQSENGKWFDNSAFIAISPEGQHPDGDTTEADDANWFSPRLLIDGWRHGLVRFAIPTWAQLQDLCRFDSVSEVLDEASRLMIHPVVGDPTDNPLYEEYFNNAPDDRIGNYRGFYNR